MKDFTGLGAGDFGCGGTGGGGGLYESDVGNTGAGGTTGLAGASGITGGAEGADGTRSTWGGAAFGSGGRWSLSRRRRWRSRGEHYRRDKTCYASAYKKNSLIFGTR